MLRRQLRCCNQQDPPTLLRRQLPEWQEWSRREWQRARMWQLQLVRRWKHKLRNYRLRQYMLCMYLRKYQLYMLSRLRKWLRQYMLYLLRHAAAQALERLQHRWKAAGAQIYQS
jgi:hypothetical protein